VLMHGRFADAYRSELEPVQNMYWRMPRAHVRRASDPQPTVELSLVVVRWWDYWKDKRRSRSHNVANEQMLLDVLEGAGSPHAAFGAQGAYEVHSAFVRGSADLATAASLLSSANMRGRRRAGLYFLWPTQRPAVERRLPAAVSEPGLLALMGRLEGEGVRTCWPHPSKLYTQLAGKRWVAQASRDRPELCVPPTVMIDYGRFQADPKGVAAEVFEELLQLCTTGSSGPKAAGSPLRGLVKLGFSWMGEDVRPFAGVEELEKVLMSMLDGASAGVVCMVQARVPAVTCELRLVGCRDRAAGPEAVVWKLVRMRQKSSRWATAEDAFSLASHETMTAAEAAACAFGGSTAALEAAEAEVERLGKLWLQWFRDEGYDTPSPAFRLDFLVSAEDGATKPRMWTVELCECGGSLCGLDHHARTAACLNECLAAGEQPLVGFPQALPPQTVVEERSYSPTTSGGAFPQSSVSPNVNKNQGVLGAVLAALSTRRGAIWLAVLSLLLAFWRRAGRRSLRG